MLVQRYENQENSLWTKVRNIEYANYNTAFAGMNGTRPFKSIKKPTDLYKLPSDIPVRGKKIKIDKDRVINKVEQFKKKQWKNKKS